MNKNNGFKSGIATTLSLLLIGITIVPSINGFTTENHCRENEIMDLPTQNGYNIVVETDRYYYLAGETVHFSGQLTKDGVGVKGRIQYAGWDPRNLNLFGGLRYTEEEGFFDIEYELWGHALLGVYKFKVEYYYNTSVFATTTFEVIPSLHIEKIAGGLFRIEATIKNRDDLNATNVNWSIKLDGGAFIGKETKGTIPIIAPDTKETITSKLILGLGATTVKVTAESSEGVSDTREHSGFVFLFFINI